MNKKSSGEEKTSKYGKKKGQKSNPTQVPRDDKEWKKLCEWLEVNIFHYQIPDQRLQTDACMILDGLRKGQGLADTRRPINGCYPCEVLLIAFQFYKNTILNGISGKDFDSEENKMRYICAVVRDHLNDVYGRYLSVKKSHEKTEMVELNTMSTKEVAEYQATTVNQKQNKKFEGLW